MSYTPPQKILEKYADVLVNFALGGGKGIKKGEVVRLSAPESAKPLYVELNKAILRAGGNVVHSYIAEDDDKYNLSRDFFSIATKAQIDFSPTKYYQAIADTIDHSVHVIAEANKHALEAVDPAKIMRRGVVAKPFKDLLNKKEDQAKFTWTLGLYGTAAMAKEAGLSLESYWQQIIKACFLDQPNPVAEWRQISKEISSNINKLNKLSIKILHIKGTDVDLHIRLGENRKWMGGSGRNIPSFEIFTSPDWRGTEGWIRFNQPLYRYDNLIEGIELEFKNGRVVKSKASRNEKVLKEMIATTGADKVGEFSLTDRRFSNITKFMAETLYDENMGGPYGNTHIALGSSYHDCYSGVASRVSKDKWQKLGFNDSSVHTDMISTTNRMVIAKLADGSDKVIYKDGCFRL